MIETTIVRTIHKGEYYQVTLKGDWIEAEKMVICGRIASLADHNTSLLMGGSTVFRFNAVRVFIIRRSREYVEKHFYLPGAFESPEGPCTDMGGAFFLGTIEGEGPDLREAV